MDLNIHNNGHSTLKLAGAFAMAAVFFGFLGFAIGWFIQQFEIKDIQQENKEYQQELANYTSVPTYNSATNNSYDSLFYEGQEFKAESIFNFGDVRFIDITQESAEPLDGVSVFSVTSPKITQYLQTLNSSGNLSFQDCSSSSSFGEIHVFDRIGAVTDDAELAEESFFYESEGDFNAAVSSGRVTQLKGGVYAGYVAPDASCWDSSIANSTFNGVKGLSSSAGLESDIISTVQNSLDNFVAL